MSQNAWNAVFLFGPSVLVILTIAILECLGTR